MRNYLKCLVAAAAFLSSPANAATDSKPAPIEARYANGDIALAAELLRPKVSGKVPAVVIIQGSGESSRRNPWARAVAEQFVANGVAVLLTDKRGSGASKGDWRLAGFEELSDDALAGVRYLKSRPDIDTTRIGLAGLSQGGRIAPIAATKDPSIAFVISLVSDAVTFPEQSFAEMANTARQAGLPDSQIDKVIALNAAAGRFLISGNWDQYAQLRTAMLASPAAPIAKAFPADRNDPSWIFLRKVVMFDPIPYWMAVDQPTLFVLGQNDDNDNVPVVESVRRLSFAFEKSRKKNASIQVLPGLGHSLGWTTSAPLADSFNRLLADWLKANVTVKMDGQKRK